MQRWKRWYHLQKQTLRNSESGITLVELLAVLAIMSVVIVLAGAVHMFGQTQFRAQTDSASQNNDYSYAMTVMTSDLRKIPLSNVSDTISLGEGNYLIDIENGPSYVYSGNQLSREGVVIIDDLSTQPIIEFGYKDEDGDVIDRIEITIQQSNYEAGMNNKDFHTTIYFRGESQSE